MTAQMRRWIAVLLMVVVLAVMGLGVSFWLTWQTVAVTEEQVQRAVVTTLQREAPASFYVTGTLDLTATATITNTKYFLPDLLDLSLGTTEATARLPGRVSYGFQIDALRAEDIRLREDGVVEVRLPPLEVFAVEPELSKMEVQTSVGWARLYRSSGRRVEQAAVRFAEEALRKQAREHLRTSSQPRVNAAEAITKMLAPVLEAAGMEEPRFRIQVGPELVMNPAG